MLDAELLESVASKLMAGTTVAVEGRSAPVRRTSRQHLKTAAFSVERHEYQAIEQNPEKPSRWDSWRGAIIGSSNSRTPRAINSWRSWSMARLRFTDLARSGNNWERLAQAIAKEQPARCTVKA